MEKLLVSIILGGALLLLSAFAVFSAFHYLNDDRAEKIFMLCVGILSLAMTVASVMAINGM